MFSRANLIYMEFTPLVHTGVYGAMGVVYLNFIKAFDTISQSILLKELAAYGMNRCTLHWVKNCLHTLAQKRGGVTTEHPELEGTYRHHQSPSSGPIQNSPKNPTKCL